LRGGPPLSLRGVSASFARWVSAPTASPSSTPSAPVYSPGLKISRRASPVAQVAEQHIIDQPRRPSAPPRPPARGRRSAEDPPACPGRRPPRILGLRLGGFKTLRTAPAKRRPSRCPPGCRVGRRQGGAERQGCCRWAGARYALRLLIARPSGSRMSGHRGFQPADSGPPPSAARSPVAGRPSRRTRPRRAPRLSATCDDRHTPSKWPGRVPPHIFSLSRATWIVVAKPAGYISAGVGMKTRLAPSRRQSSRSRSRGRGYFARSRAARTVPG